MSKQRGLPLNVNDTTDLTITLYDNNGNPSDPDSNLVPAITIIQPGGLVFLPNTSIGVMRLAQGQYSYTHKIPFSGPYGVWNDIWVYKMGGNTITQTLSFMVTGTQIPQNPNQDGLVHLGDDFPFVYSEVATHNINKLLKMLEKRLNSKGLSKSKDLSGNITFTECSTFANDTLVTFLAMALSYFNETPHFTMFTFDDTPFIAQFGEALVSLAAAYGLLSKSLIEVGSELTITDNGISMSPAKVSDMLKGQGDTLMTATMEHIKNIKSSMKPLPLLLGTFNIMSSSKSPFVKVQQRKREGRVV